MGCSVTRQDQYLFGDVICLTIFLIWYRDISEGKFPYQIADSTPIGKAIDTIHHILDMEFEVRLIEKSKKILGLKNVEGKIDNFKRLSQDFPSKPDSGEIDLFAINPSNKKIFVLDAKNRRRRLRPADIRVDWRAFFEGDKAYYTLLHRKIQFVVTNIIKILNHFGIEYPVEWEILAAFIVVHNYLAVFARDFDVLFINIKNLNAFTWR